MSETAHEISQTVWWINKHESLGVSERVKKWLYETANRGTYIPKEKIPFSTSIPFEEIDDLTDPSLKEALVRQHNNIINNDASLTVPVATIRTRELSHVWTVPRAPTIKSE